MQCPVSASSLQAPQACQPEGKLPSQPGEYPPGWRGSLYCNDSVCSVQVNVTVVQPDLDAGVSLSNSLKRSVSSGRLATAISSAVGYDVSVTSDTDNRMYVLAQAALTQAQIAAGITRELCPNICKTESVLASRFWCCLSACCIPHSIKETMSPSVTARRVSACHCAVIAHAYFGVIAFV